jgi:hypothetical protein
VKIFLFLSIILIVFLAHCQLDKEQHSTLGLSTARESAKIAGYSLSKVQRWLHEVALPKIDPETHLYISHTSGSARYRSLWNYDDAAADTYPFLFWAAFYTDYKQVNGPILDVLLAEQRICNYLDRIPTAVNHRTLEKEIKSRDDLIFAASEYVKDGLIAIVEVAGKDNPWFDRMREIEDDIWKNADIPTAFGKIPTKNLEANGEQIQVLVRLFTATKEAKYLDWAERLADYYLSQENFVPERLRDHGCEIIGGLGLLLAVESEHRPEKAQFYLPRIKRMLDEILERGINEDGLMYNFLGNRESGLSDGWGYNYVTYLCYDMVVAKPHYRAHLEKTLGNLLKPIYMNYPWETGATGAINQSIDGYADALEGAIYLLNRLPIPEGIEWVNREMARNVTQTGAHLGTTNLWGTYKLESNGVRTVLIHALMHTRGIIARPWKAGLELGAHETDDGLLVFLKSESDWSGSLVFDKPRHRIEMGFKFDWPRMNTMPEWFTAEPGKNYTVSNVTRETEETYSGKQLSEGLDLELKAAEEIKFIIE